MANQILAGAVFQAGQVIAGVDADNPPYVGPAAELVIPSESANIVTIVDSGTMEVTHTLTNPYPNGSNWGMRSNTNGRSLYVTGYSDGHPNYTKNTVIYDLDNLSAAPVVPTASGTLYSNIAFTDGKAFAIVSPDGSSSGRELAEIDPTTLEKISVIPNPAGIASTSGFLGGPLFAYSGKVYKGDTDYQGSQTGTSNGKVFVFDAADGSLLQEISSPSTSSNYPDINRFGSNVAVNDSWVAVTGYTTKDSNGIGVGSVHVYDANDLGGSPVELFSSSNQRMFGSDLAVSGDYVFVGSRSEDGNDGRVHVFDMSNGGSLVISLEVSDIFSDDTDMFGAFLAANETHLFVNAPNHRHQTTFEYVGAVHKFAISDLSGSYESILGETNQQFYVSGGLTNFGVADLPVSAPAVTPSASPYSQAAEGTWVVATAAMFGNNFNGQAFIMREGGNNITLSTPATGNMVGSAVAVSDDYVFVGNLHYDGFGDNAGAIFVFDKNTGSMVNTLQASTSTANTTFGDLDVEAKADSNRIATRMSKRAQIVGSPNESYGYGHIEIMDHDGSNRVHINHPDFDPNLGYANNIYFGRSSGWTTNKFVTSAYGADAGGNSSGSLLIYNPEDGSIATRIDGTQVNENFGNDIATQSNHTRILVGAKGWNNNAGRVILYEEDGTEVMTIERPSVRADAKFGNCVAYGSGRIVVSENLDTSVGRFFIFNEEDGSLINTITGPRNDNFASNSLDIAGNYIFASASGVNSNNGAFWVYDLDGNNGTRIDNIGTSGFAHFGAKLAASVE